MHEKRNTIGWRLNEARIRSCASEDLINLLMHEKPAVKRFGWLAGNTIGWQLNGARVRSCVMEDVRFSGVWFPDTNASDEEAGSGCYICR